jgi:hypothetical protein
MFLLLINFLFALFPIISVYFYLREKQKLDKIFIDTTKPKSDPELVEELLGDFKQKGFSIIRIDSNDILYRTPRG